MKTASFMVKSLFSICSPKNLFDFTWFSLDQAPVCTCRMKHAFAGFVMGELCIWENYWLKRLSPGFTSRLWICPGGAISHTYIHKYMLLMSSTRITKCFVIIITVAWIWSLWYHIFECLIYCNGNIWSTWPYLTILSTWLRILYYDTPNTKNVKVFSGQ